MSRKSCVFVGSSSESSNAGITDIFCHALRSPSASVVPWTDVPEFKATTSTMESLLQATKHYDFGFFIFTPDDHIESRGATALMGRDNVLFEFGLFLGALGATRVFGVVQDKKTQPGERIKVPTDLWGINMPRFEFSSDSRIMAGEASGAISQIKSQIKEAGPKPLDIRPIITWGFDPQKAEFIVTLDKGILSHKAQHLFGMKISLVVRKRDSGINNHEDTKIAVLPPRELPKPLNSDVMLTVPTSSRIAPVAAGDWLEGYLLLVPPECDLLSAETIEEMYGMGCELLEDVARRVE